MNQIREMEQMHRRAVELQDAINQGSATLDNVLELAAISCAPARTAVSRYRPPDHAKYQSAAASVSGTGETGRPNPSPRGWNSCSPPWAISKTRTGGRRRWKEIACIQLALGRQDQSLRSLRRAVTSAATRCASPCARNSGWPAANQSQLPATLEAAAEAGFRPILRTGFWKELPAPRRARGGAFVFDFPAIVLPLPDSGF